MRDKLFSNQAQDILHETWERVIAVQPLMKKLADNDLTHDLAKAVTQGIISQREASLLRSVDQARQEIMAIDDFDTAELTHKKRSVKRQPTPHHCETVAGTDGTAGSWWAQPIQGA